MIGSVPWDGVHNHCRVALAKSPEARDAATDPAGVHWCWYKSGMHRTGDEAKAPACRHETRWALNRMGKLQNVCDQPNKLHGASPAVQGHQVAVRPRSVQNLIERVRVRVEMETSWKRSRRPQRPAPQKAQPILH